MDLTVITSLINSITTLMEAAVNASSKSLKLKDYQELLIQVSKGLLSCAEVLQTQGRLLIAHHEILLKLMQDQFPEIPRDLLEISENN